MSKKLTALFALTLVGAACGGDDSTTLDDGSAAEGIYALYEWTNNDAGCDAPGVSILDSMPQQHLVVASTSLLGMPLLSVRTCDSVAACRALGNDSTAIMFGMNMDAGNLADGWTGKTVFAGSAGSDSCDGCEGSTIEHHLRLDGDTLLLDSRTLQTVTFMPGPDCICSTDAVENAGSPACQSLQTMTGTRVGEL